MRPPSRFPKGADSTRNDVAPTRVAGAAPMRTTRRKPKPKATSVVQREERDRLLREAFELEELLETLRVRAGLPSRQDKAAILEATARLEDMDDKLVANDQSISRLDSCLTNELLLPQVNPLSTFIHLPRDMAQRRHILRSMQEHKLRRGVEIATSWLHHLDHAAPYLSEQGVLTTSGEYHYKRLEIDQFPNFTNARQLYDTYLDYLYNLEINVTDSLGQLTVREDAEEIAEPTLWNHRILTVNKDIGVPEELNRVGFAHFYEYSTVTNSPMGVILYDTVNIDDLYPYVPDERTCKESQSIKLVFEICKPGSQEKIVVLKQLWFAVQLPPQFKVAPGVFEKLCENFPNWPNAMAKYLHEYVVPDAVEGRCK